MDKNVGFLKHLSNRVESDFGVRLTDLERRWTEYGYRWTVKVDGKVLSLGSIENLLDFRRFRNSCADRLKIVPRKGSPVLWDKFVGAFVESAKDIR